MKIKLLYLIVLSFLINGYTFAQFKISENNFLNEKKDTEFIHFFVKGDLTVLDRNEKDIPFQIKYKNNNIAAIKITKNNLLAFYNAFPNLSKEIPTGKGTILMDTALIHNNVVPAHNGQAPLTQAYTGKDVVVGIIDAGIYFQHQDFKNADGSTRIKFIWDQNVQNSINKPQPYDYGQEWSYVDINNGTCNHVEPANQYGHGTTVAGAACGNGTATGTHKGVAPESDIIAVAINYDNFLNNVVDAIDYIFKKADAMGKPCVINTSIGSYWGAHDGFDIPTQMIDALIEEKAGRAVVAAAGNGNNINNASAGYIPTHLSYPLSTDTNFTWFKTIGSSGKVYFSLWTDTNTINNFHFALGNDDATDYHTISRTNFFSKADFVGDLNNGVYIQKFAYDTAINLQGTIEMFLIKDNNRYNLEVQITPISTSNLWRFMCYGQGSFDIWSSQAFQGTSNMVFNNLPPNFVVTDIDNYKTPDNEKCIVSSWQCSDKVITVGNFANRAYYYDVDTTFRQTGLTAGEIYYQSSEGPTRDLRLKPDISSTGNIVFATGNANFIATALAVNRPKVAIGAKHNYNGGTSMASPLVAGAVALYLEKNPDAWWYETKTALIKSARRDTFTGPNANTVYGNGKLDAFEMLKFEAVLGCTSPGMFNYNPNANVDDGSCVPFIYGCTDSTAFNYNPNANTDDGTCVAIVYGCTDSTAFNYDSLANINDGSCVPIVYGCTDSTAYNYNPQANIDNGSCIATAISTIKDKHSFTIQPNPATDFVNISGSISNFEIELYSILGKKVMQKTVSNHDESINLKDLSAGMYLLNFVHEGKTIESKKLIKK